MFKFNNKDNRYFTPCSCVSFVNFEQVNAGWVANCKCCDLEKSLEDCYQVLPPTDVFRALSNIFMFHRVLNMLASPNILTSSKYVSRVQYFLS